MDEYQDTNFAQHLIVKRLCEGRGNLCVVGDDAQSIYSFRGANIDNILQFKQLYPGCQIFKLERNYRSTQNIVNAANSLIRKNTAQIPKQVYSEKEEGSKLQVLSSYSDYEEAYAVAARVQEMRRQMPYADMAVCTVQMLSLVSWKKPCASGTFLTGFTVACRFISEKR